MRRRPWRQALAQRFVAAVAGRRRARHRRQFGRRNRHPEQAHRQRVEHLRVRQARHRAGREQAREQRVDVGADLHDAAAHEHRHEIAHHRAHIARHGERGPAPGMAEDRQDRRELDAELERTADHRRDTEIDRQFRKGTTRSEEPEGRNHRGVPHDGRRIRDEEPAVAVQDAETPGRNHQETGARKEDAHQRGRQRALGTAEAGRDHADEQRRQQHAGDDQHRRDQRQDPEDRPRHAVRLVLAIARQQSRVDGNERRRQGAFAEQVLEQVRDPERRVERVARVGLHGEEMAEERDPREPCDAAEQNARGDERGRARRTGGGFGRHRCRPSTGPGVPRPVERDSVSLLRVYFPTVNGAVAMLLSHMITSLPPLAVTSAKSRQAGRSRAASCPLSSRRARRPCRPCSRSRPRAPPCWTGRTFPAPAMMDTTSVQSVGDFRSMNIV